MKLKNARGLLLQSIDIPFMNIPGQPLYEDRNDKDNLSGVYTGPVEYLETCSLVLSAVGIHHTFDRERSILTVPASQSDLAQRQLDLYFRENAGWPEVQVPVKVPTSTEKPPTLMMIGGLVLFFLVTGPWQENTLWFGSGAIDSQAILKHNEWWRLITALTLHADQVHLLGNCIIGGFLVHMLCRTIGSGLGWFSLIICGALGNFINIVVRDQAHHSVGFSTSIFAAIGLFSGLQMLAGNKPRLKGLLIPLGAGAGLLAMLGTEGERTDLGAHFFGFICGLSLGFLFSCLDVEKLVVNHSLQRKLFMITLMVILVSWMAAGQ